MQKMLKRVFWRVSGVVLLSLFGIAGYLYASSRHDFVVQRKAFESTEQLEPTDWREQALLDPGRRMNEIQFWATHNSYHMEPDALRLFLVGLRDASSAASMRYSHPRLSNQLDAGIRGLELDLRQREELFCVIHVPLVDDRSTCPDFELALREIQAWSNAHAGHVPIVVLLELKEEFGGLSPGFLDFESASLDAIDQLIYSIFSTDQLIIPDQIRGDSDTLEEAVLTNGWPPLEKVLGQVMFVLHKDQQLRSWYIEDRTSLEGRAMFTCAEPGQPDCAFILYNNPDVEAIAALVQQGYFVRTMSDSQLRVSEERRIRAIKSGAQMLSTDFPKGFLAGESEGISSDGKRVMIRRTRKEAHN